MSDVPNAIRYIYSLDMGKAYDKTLLTVLHAYRRGGAAMVVSLLQTPEMYGDPCAKALREFLGVKGSKGGSPMFSFCQSKRSGGGAPFWVKDHGWRVKKWTSFTPYIQPTPVKE
jgi:hypothetical protein